MSGGDRTPPARDAGSLANNTTPSSENRMRDEAFEELKREAISVTRNGGVSLTPDLYWTLHKGSSPWTPLPADTFPHPPGDQKPQLPQEGKLQQPGESKPQAPGDFKPGETKPLEPIPNFPMPSPLHGDGGLLHSSPEIETTFSKASREALVVGGGVGESFFYGIADLPKHLPQIATSMLVGAGLAAISRTGTLGAGAALVVGAYFTTRFILDTVNDHKRWDTFGTALKDTWNSSDHLTENIHKVRDTFGDYTFDTTLSLASSYVGWKNPQLADLLIQILRVPPFIPSAPLPFSPAVTAATFALGVMPPSGFYQHYNDRTPFANNSWECDEKGHLRRRSDGITRMPELFDRGNPERDHDDYYDRR